jgi:ABC-type multidrug transport system ATPase subunit
VSLDAEPGAVTAVVGGDGAGKSTLLRALAGLVRPSSGVVRRPPRTGLGYLSSPVGVYHDLTVDENLAFAAVGYGVRGAVLDERRERLLDDAGLTAARSRLAGRLSGGMRQKLAFAMAMVHTPDLLVLDEPTTGVDPVSRLEFWRLLTAGAGAGAAVVFSTTYLDEAARASRVLVLDDGRAVAAGAPAEVLRDLPRPLPRRPHDLGDAAPVVETRAAVRRFGALAAVDRVDLAVRPGEVVGLLGANGAGKTTLIRMLLGLVGPSAGHVLLFGAPPSRAARRRVGYVPQGLGLWEDLTVAQNLEFACDAFGVPQPSLDDQLAAMRADLVRDLPLGLRRRLAFVAALAHDPDVLILDEPTSGVGPAARASLWRTVHDAADEGAAVLVTTHFMEEADQCDRLAVMADGRLVAEGPPARLVAPEESFEDAFARLVAQPVRAETRA